MAPTLQSIWLAEAVTLNEKTGRLDIVGAFDRIDIQPGATSASGAIVYFAVRGVHGRVRLQLVCRDLADDEPILKRDVFVDSTPLETMDLTVRLNEIPVPHPGTYAWEVSFGGDTIGSTRVEVVVKDQES